MTYAGRVERFNIFDEDESDEDVSGTIYTTRGDWNDTIAAAIYGRTDGFSGRYAVSAGVVHPNSLPFQGSATWNGDMVGLDSNNRTVRGGATLTIADFSAPRVDVTLTPNGRSAMYWRGLTLTSGKFSQVQSSNDYIRGEFYGKEAEESGGVFERAGIVGAFAGER